MRKLFGGSVVLSAVVMALCVHYAHAGTIIVSGGSTRTTTIGSGKNDTSHAYVVIEDKATLDTGKKSAISLGSGVSSSNPSEIWIGYQALDNPNGNFGVGPTLVTNSPTGGDTGYPGAGNNTIELTSFYAINISKNAIVQSVGSQNNAEAISVMGYGNVITNHGTIHSDHGAALWFQDSSVTSNEAERNQIINYGTISTGVGDTANVFGSSRGSSGPGLYFENNGLVSGSLSFGNGDDTLLFGAGSKVTGSINGGGGFNDLTLQGHGASYDILPGWVRNFQTLTKKDEGTWTMTGKLEGFISTTVEKGTLRVTGDNAGYSGDLTIQSNGIVEAKGRSLPTNMAHQPNIQNDGTLNLYQDAGEHDTYSGIINGSGSVIKTGKGETVLNAWSSGNTYSGATKILDGTLGVANDFALGAVGSQGTLQIGAEATRDDVSYASFLKDPYRANLYGGSDDGTTPGSFITAGPGTLKLYGDLYMPTRPVTIGSQGAIIDTQTYTGTIFQGITDAKTGGTGGLTKTGVGLLVLNGENTYSGDTVVEQGRLQVNSNGAGNMVTGQVKVKQAGILEGTGTLGNAVVTLPLLNSGTVSPGLRRTAGGVLTIRGDYKGEAGGRVEINSVLGDDNSLTSRLDIDGNVAAGALSNTVKVVNIRGNGGITNQGIKVIDFTNGNGGAVNDAKYFTLEPDFYYGDKPVVVGGAYAYYLEQGPGRVVTNNDGDWYLKTQFQDNGVTPPGPPNPNTPTPPPVLHPSTPLYTIYPSVMSEFAFLTNPTLMERVGNESWGCPAADAGAASQNAYASLDSRMRRFIQQKGIYARVDRARAQMSPKSVQHGDADYKADFWRVQLGMHYPLIKRGDGSGLLAGLAGFAGRAAADVNGDDGCGKVKSDIFGFSGTLTWYSAGGFYADAKATFSLYDTDIQSHTLLANNQIKGNDGYSYLLGLEVGKIFEPCNGWSITPQTELTYTRSWFDDFYDAQNAYVRSDDSINLTSRTGFEVNKTFSYTSAGGDRRRTELYSTVNYYYDFKNSSKVSIGDVLYENDGDKHWGGIAVGGTYEWCDSKYALFGEVGVRTAFRDFGKNRVAHGQVGFRYNF